MPLIGPLGNLTDPAAGTLSGSIQSISGDIWILANATWDGADFHRIDVTKAAYGYQIQGQGFIPGEPDLGYFVSGATLWVAQPESYTLIRATGSPSGAVYGSIGGWELGWTLSQQRQMTIGGGGLEVDGYGTYPYTRVVANTTGNVLSRHIAGMARNAFTALDDADDRTKESWFWGYVDQFTTDPTTFTPGTNHWAVAYIPANTMPASSSFDEYLTVSAAGIVQVSADPTTSLGVATKHYVDSVAVTGGIALYAPSDPTGATDMTSELEAFRIANLGKLVKVADGSTILLTNAFSTATTGDILLDFSNCTILYDNMTQNDYAIQCNNTANAGTEVSVSSMAMATVNTDATVTQLTLGSTISGSRFDWVAVYSTDANPAISGGQYGEIFQLLADESSLVLTATRKLNNYGFYATSVKARKLDATRRVYIKGGIVQANGNTEDHTITSRAGAILVQGFVDPLVEGVTFDHPWSLCLRFQCCAAPKARDISVRDVGNLALYNGFTYGVYFYGMNDAGDARNLVVRNGRHAGFTTDGNSGGTTTWYAKGIPTNLSVTGVHGYNCHASVVDTHEEGDGIVIDGVQDFYPYQDADISPDFTGLGCQIRAANVTLRNFFVYGGTQGIRVNAIDHGFEDQVTLENINIGNLAPSSLSTNLGDVGITLDDQSGLTNKRHVYFDGVMNNVGQAFLVGKTAKLTLRSVSIRRAITLMDAGAGAIVTFAGQAEFDYRNPVRTSPAPTPAGITVRSDSPNGGASVVFLQRPKVIMGATSAPSVLLTEADTTATKLYYADGVTVYNPSAVTPVTLKSGSTTTMSLAAVTGGGSSSGTTAVDSITTSGTNTYTLAAATYGAFNITLGSASVPTFDFTGASAGLDVSITVVLTQPSGGGVTVAWGSTITWIGGSAPVLNTGTSAVSIFVFESVDGSTWIGSMVTGPELGSAATTAVSIGTSAGESTIASVTIPANLPAQATYRITAYGTITVGGTGGTTLMHTRLGGLSGTQVQTFTSASLTSSDTYNWRAVAEVTLQSPGSSGTWAGDLEATQNIQGSAGAVYLANPGTATVNSTTAQVFALTLTLSSATSTASCTDSICERVA